MTTLGQKARVAVAWNAGFSLFRDLLQFAVTIMLVRLLTPESYGQFGLVTTIIGFLNVLSLENFIAHTLQVRRDHDVHYQDHFTAGAVIQFSLCFLTNLVAVALRWIEAYAAIAPLLHVMSVAFVLDCPSALRVKMLERALDWKRLRLLHAIGLIMASGLAVFMAAAGAGVYALLVPGLVKRMVFTGDLFVAHRWRPMWVWNAKTYKPAWRFGLARMSSASLIAGRKLLESGLFVHLVGFASFGLYGRAMGLAYIFCYKFAFLFMQAIYPVLTKIESDSDAYNRASGLALRSVTWTVMPVAVLSAVLAEPIVRIIYGDQWEAVIPLLPWAMVSMAAGAIAHVVYMLMLANQQHTFCLLTDLWMLLGTGITLIWLLPKGMGAYLVGSGMIQIIALLFIASRLFNERAVVFTVISSAIIRPLATAIGAFVLCESVRLWMGVDVQYFWSVCVYGMGFSVVYVGILRLLFASQLGELVRYLPGAHRLNRVLVLGV